MIKIGESPPRPDGLAKVTGGARYTDDLTVPGMVFGATLRSPHPHARIKSLKWRPDRAPEGSVCVTARDLPGANGVQLLDDTWPVLASDVVRHVGEAVALVAAPTRLDARLALQAIEVEYEPLPPVLTWEEAEAVEPLNELGHEPRRRGARPGRVRRDRGGGVPDRPPGAHLHRAPGDAGLVRAGRRPGS